MDLDDWGGYTLRELGSINIIVGKNGCGKSLLLTVLEGQHPVDEWRVSYITPERGGSLNYRPNVEDSITSNADWLAQTRRRNQYSQFREQSAAQFRLLELLTLKEIESIPEVRRSTITFNTVVDSINDLLDNVQIRRAKTGFTIHLREDDGEIIPENISSGESELISLAIECLVFSKDCDSEKKNLLLFDEPDLHLHPDLQYRFAQFIASLVGEDQFKVIIATHSTSLIAAFNELEDSRISFMQPGDKILSFKGISDIHRTVIPIFGAHPLSNVFNESPILLVEGEDDVRIWQQAVRSSEGQMKLSPAAVGCISELNQFEKLAVEIMSAVYDDAVGYSLRDRDDLTEFQEIDDLLPIVRFRLHCRSAENLLVSEEVLKYLGTNWASLEQVMRDWITKNSEHPRYDEMNSWQENGYDRELSDLKPLRNLILQFFDTTKPWEVAVGSVIATLRQSEMTTEPNSIYSFLGEKVINNIILK